MGAGQSTAEASSYSQALHVLRVTPSSPASQTDIEPFFDFIVGFEGDSRPSHSNIDVNELEKIVEDHEGRVLNLHVFSSKNQDTRVVSIVPSRTWTQLPGEQQDENAQPSLLGLSMRMCSPEFALDNVWHVLDVLEGSPAESAGLVPYGDYITGWSGGVLSAENDFYDLVEAHCDKPLRVYVYSYDFDTLREVVLVPNRHWGGEGLLGCVFGFGLLHRIPPQNPDHIPGSVPPELLGEEDYHEEQLFVPADTHADRIADWRHEENHSHPFQDHSENAVPGLEPSHLNDVEEEEEEFPSQGTPRIPLGGVISPGFQRASSSLGSTFMNGSTKSFFPLNDDRISSPFLRNALGRQDSEEGSDDGEQQSVADTDVSHESGSLTSVD